MPSSLAAATGAEAEVLLDLFVVLLATMVGAAVFRRLGQPRIIGQVVAGMIVGPSVLGVVGPNEVLRVFAELGVVFILFWVGLETRLSHVWAVARPATAVGTLGIALPFAAGAAAADALGMDAATSVFVGAALVATSTGITSAVLLELRALHLRVGRTIVAAAVVDDILAMIILSVATGIAAGGSLEFTTLLVTLLLASGFVAFFALGGTAFVRRRPHLLVAPSFAESPTLPIVIACLGLAAFAAELGLAAIVGAFLAGLIVAETREQFAVEKEVAPLYAFFPPFFFGGIGIEVELGALADAGAIGLLALVTAIAVVTKLVGAYIGALPLGRREALFVGVAMIPRGEVGIIVASIGSSAGVIDEEIFAIIVCMSLVTTLLAPPLLRALMRSGEHAWAA